MSPRRAPRSANGFSAQRLVQAVIASKKKQLRKTTTPAVLAVNTSPFGDVEEWVKTISHVLASQQETDGPDIEEVSVVV